MMPTFQSLTEPSFHSVCFAFDSPSQASFETCVDLIKVPPKQIIRPGDIHPNTGRPFIDPYTGKALEKSSWILSERKERWEARDLNATLASLGGQLLPYSEAIAEMVEQGGSSSFDVAWGVHLDSPHVIKGPLITKASWKLIHRFKAELGFAFYESTGEDESPQTVGDKDRFKHSFLDIRIKHRSLIKFVHKSPRTEGISALLSACENALKQNRAVLENLLKKESCDLEIIIHKRTDCFSYGIIFSPTLVAYLAQFNAHVFFLDSSAHLPE
ncbi:MAG: hypothetical protein ACO1RX_08580 [Candidatus Sericytochromatia bacterium]